MRRAPRGLYKCALCTSARSNSSSLPSATVLLSSHSSKHSHGGLVPFCHGCRLRRQCLPSRICRLFSSLGLSSLSTIPSRKSSSKRKKCVQRYSEQILACGVDTHCAAKESLPPVPIRVPSSNSRPPGDLSRICRLTALVLIRCTL